MGELNTRGFVTTNRFEVGLTANDLRFTPPDLPEDELRKFLQQNYGVSGDFKRLAGERDQNFRVRQPDGTSYVYKISSPDEVQSLVDFQIRALEHIEHTNPALPVPRQIRSLDGELSTTLQDAQGREHAVRLLSYLAGEPMADFGEASSLTARRLGALQGSLCRTLQSFSHPAATQFMPWDSMNGLVISPSLRNNYLPPEILDRCIPVLAHLEQEALPIMHSFDAQVIHNDAHAGNVMVDPGDREHITGLIDFGDMVQRPIVVDISISMASMMDTCSDGLATARALVSGFEEHMVLPDAQREVLYDAVLARQLLTVQLLTFRAMHTRCSPELLEVDVPETIAGLLKTMDIDRNEFLDAIQGDD